MIGVGSKERGWSLACFGYLDLRAQDKVPSALRTDTPTHLALVDVAAAPNGIIRSYGGVSDAPRSV
jgi:hypothetical protein